MQPRRVARGVAAERVEIGGVALCRIVVGDLTVLPLDHLPREPPMA
jgi:hypothetical protein